MASSTPYIAAAGAIAATWLLEQVGTGGGALATLIPAARPVGTDRGLEAAARSDLACGVRRLSDVTTLTGARIRTSGPLGAGEDFIREFLIQRSSLTRALGDLGIPGLTNRPRLTAACSSEWLALWLDAFAVANGANPKAFAIDHGRPSTAGPFLTRVYDPIGDWRSAAPIGDPSPLGRLVTRARGLYTEARIVEAVPFVGELPWIRARQVTELLQDLAAMLDWAAGVAAANGQISGEALATLRRDLHPVRVVEKVVDVAVGAAELALDKVVGPVAAATVGALAMTLLPWLVVGGATYFLVRRAM